MVIRFCKVIGYHGYSELQADVQHALLSLKPIENLNNNEPLNSFEGVMRMDQQNIHQLSSKLDWDTAEKIVDTLVLSKGIIVIGYYHSFSYAHWFSFLLSHLLEQTLLYRPETDTGVKNKGKEYAVIIFSYYRYALESIRLAEEAKANNNTIIVITDSQLSPLASLGDYVLNIQIEQKSILEKGPVTFSVLNALLLHIAQKVGKLDFLNPTNKFYIR